MTAPAAKRCDTVDSPSAAQLWLTPGPDCSELVDEFVASHGQRVDVDGLLDSLGLDSLGFDKLDRGLLGFLRWSSRPSRAVEVKPPAPIATYGFRWRFWDCLTLRWWPQGITTSADASDTGVVGGREVVVVSWYAKRVRGRSLGVRLSFIDVTDRDRPTYRHVLLVEPVRDDRSGVVEPRLVRVHAGGVVWYGPSVWVADTYGGFRLFDLNDAVRLGGDHIEGYRYVLPQRTSYLNAADEGAQPFRFSFVSLDRSGAVPWLLTGEYGDLAAPRRVARYRLDPGSGRLAVTDDGCARPVELVTDGPQRMQGAVAMNGRHYLATSNGRWRRGNLWTTKPGEGPQDQGSVLAVGPEDLAYWPQRDELWNLSEHPLRRYVYALPPLHQSERSCT
ncbi:MAG: hypothetical protein H0U51_04635 [Propionibacteriales bacterium]|nr:hypothetical protein [Propionibacteriales bacterium]